MRVLSVQSSVVYGYVGNSAAAFALQRLGHEVWAIPTVLLAHHTGYGRWVGAATAASLISEIIGGISDLALLGTTDAVLSGYLGTPEVADVVRRTVAAVREQNPRAVYCCDPVIGDVGPGMYVRPGVADVIRERLLGMSDVVTPNIFELAYLTGTRLDDGSAPPIADQAALLAAADALRSRGPSVVLVTSVPGEPGGDSAFGEADSIGMLAVGPSGAYRVDTPRLDIAASGAGDLTAAIFLANVTSHPLDEALAQTAAAVFAVLSATEQTGGLELSLIAAQGAMVNPARVFPVRRIY